mmetsp:Transcript_31408/g.68981  ORF Transcript_31408/g.68981 Transcript_31408/m.68981 type:complete len:122 (-) Transcript_31408:1167-1532(-)
MWTSDQINYVFNGRNHLTYSAAAAAVGIAAAGAPPQIRWDDSRPVEDQVSRMHLAARSSLSPCGFDCCGVFSLSLFTHTSTISPQLVSPPLPIATPLLGSVHNTNNTRDGKPQKRRLLAVG